MPSPSGIDYRQHLQVETPEHVTLDYEVAGVGSRLLGSIADWCLLTIMVIGGALIARWLGGVSKWAVSLQVVIVWAMITGYFALFEGFRQGVTPGKKWMGLRVVRDTGHGVTFADALVRNLLLPIDIGFCFVGLFFIAIHPRAKRLGDLVAGTVVVRDRPASVVSPRSSASTILPVGSEHRAPELDDDEFRLLREYIRRAPELPDTVRLRIARDLATRLAVRIPRHGESDVAFLDSVHQAELASRQGRFGARAGGRGGNAVAERLVARKAASWEAFQVDVSRAASRGLDSFAAHELPQFAARYREVAADLARARTYGADAPVLARLERIVAAGHNVLYRSDRHTWRRIWHFASRDCPGAVVESWRVVTLAFFAFALPGIAGFALLRQQPQLAPEVLPDAMLERAEAGAARQAAGQGYVFSERGERPVIATSIITNNIGVAFRCFAGGILFGVGALVMLAYNGLMIGASSGHFANVGLLPYLWTFIIGHGALELFAIWVAGAAGFLLGRAIIAPGALPRRDALVLAGRQAMRLIGAAVILLLIAGTIEGFLSTSRASVGMRLAVSGGSLLFLAVFLINGARREARSERREA